VYKYSEYYGKHEKFIGYLTQSKYSGEELGVIAKESGGISEIIAKVYGGSDPLRGDKGTRSEIQGTGESVVSSFYLALAKADGELAASYLVAEKRAAGPFAPQNITRFYSSLIRPLIPTSVESLSPGVYAARYNFVEKSGRYCDGRSVVTTTWRNGAEFILSVKVLSGC
jgi:hypothetical protein